MPAQLGRDIRSRTPFRGILRNPREILATLENSKTIMEILKTFWKFWEVPDKDKEDKDNRVRTGRGAALNAS